MNTKQRKMIIALMGIIIIVSGISLLPDSFQIPSINLPGFNISLPAINVNVNTEGNTESSQAPAPTPPPESERTADTHPPTQLLLQLQPNPVQRGNVLGIAVLSDGYNTGITIHARHLGKDQTETMPGLVGTDGKFTHIWTPDIAGQYEAWVTSGDVESPKVAINVEGLHVIIEDDYALICSHYTGTAHVWASHREYGGGPDFGDIPLSNGYAEVYLDLSHPTWSPGVYDIDAQVGSVKASDTNSMGVVVIP